MCSLFQNKETGISIFERLKKNSNGKFIIEDIPDDIKKERIAPTDKIISIFPGKISSGNWGIKFDENAPTIFNSRIETIKSKPNWTKLFSSNRCIIPATAFYEWKVTGDDGKKLPHRISVDNDLFFIPSIFVKKNESTMISMITTEPNDFMKSVHNRMPCIINIDEIEYYLGDDKNIALQYCIPFKENNKMKIEIANDLTRPKKSK